MVTDGCPSRVEVPRRGLASTPHSHAIKSWLKGRCVEVGDCQVGEDASQLKVLKWKGLLK